LSGGAGRDVLIGGGGTDALRGGGGADRFVFSARSGDDRVLDFAPGVDVLQINSGADRFADLELRDEPGGAVVSFGDASATLRGVEASALDAQDFLF
ncbi:MAG: alkaline metalloproteinase, partial [Pseudomonadota bacterium]